MAAKNKLSLSVQYADARLAEALPRTVIRRWVQAALAGPAELTIRFVAQEEGQMLNRDYRGKDYATNVLTFAYSEEEEEAAITQADIILCTDVLMREAAEQKIPLEQHAAHLVVHGTLHAQVMTTKMTTRPQRWNSGKRAFWRVWACPILMRSIKGRQKFAAKSNVRQTCRQPAQCLMSALSFSITQQWSKHPHFYCILLHS